MKNKKVVITGGAEFIGSHLAEELAEIMKLLLLTISSQENWKNIKHLLNEEKIVFKKENIRDLDFLKIAFQDADYVFHQAAIVSIPLSIENPVLANNVNVKRTLNVLIAVKDCGVKKVIFALSCNVYGDNPNLPLRGCASKTFISFEPGHSLEKGLEKQ